MSDFTNTHESSIAGAPNVEQRKPHRAGFRLQETYWGYAIVKLGPPPVSLIAMQSISLIGGAGCLAAAFALMWRADHVDMIVRAPLAVVCTALGAMLLWYASRGIQSQIEIDTTRGEVREVARNRLGVSTVIASYGFDCIGSVFISRVAGRRPVLSLRYRNTARRLDVACAEEVDLERLRDRLGRDLIISRDASI